ncbi:membrane protein [Salmonella enterica subsp. enterica]|nr:membrane protein [Salmonella enterica subsp. enterica]
MPKITPLSRFARLDKHLKNALRGVGIGSCIYVIIESIMHGTINGVEAAGVLTISAVLGLLERSFGYQSKATLSPNPAAFSPLRQLRRADGSNAVGSEPFPG